MEVTATQDTVMERVAWYQDVESGIIITIIITEGIHTEISEGTQGQEDMEDSQRLPLMINVMIMVNEMLQLQANEWLAVAEEFVDSLNTIDVDEVVEDSHMKWWSWRWDQVI